MHLKTSDFTRVIGETHSVVRNVYGRPGREPRHPGAESYTPTNHRKFYWIDAVAWRIARQLTELGLTWDQAAELCSESYVARWALKRPEDCAGHFFAVWGAVTMTQPAGPVLEHSFTSWMGTPADISEAIALDASKDAAGAKNFTGLSGVRMVSLHRAIVSARMLARQAGFEPTGEGFERIDGETVAEST